jgi:steroid 5-alpha reductase family enzyme
MISLAQLLFVNLGVVLALMTAVWIVSVYRSEASLIDPFWGAGFVLIAWVSLLLSRQPSARVLLLAILTTLWGGRLSVFLLWRNWGHGEDRRYAAMRSKRPESFWWTSLFTVFLLQGVLLWFISFPIQVAIFRNALNPLGLFDVLGLAIWLIGLFFEAVGDWQLARFTSNPENAGKVLDRGLWALTRHPNYFGDFCIWWGLYLIAASGGAGWTVLSPLLMTVFLMKVSGVGLLERTIVNRRPEYAQYQARTNAFFPGPVRRRES